jgi:hypothetical protein
MRGVIDRSAIGLVTETVQQGCHPTQRHGRLSLTLYIIRADILHPVQRGMGITRSEISPGTVLVRQLREVLEQQVVEQIKDRP